MATLRDKLFIRCFEMLVHKDVDGDFSTEVELAQQAADKAVERLAAGREMRGEPPLDPDVDLDGGAVAANVTKQLEALKTALLAAVDAKLAELPDHAATIDDLRAKVKEHLTNLTQTVNGLSTSVETLKVAGGATDGLVADLLAEVEALKAEVAALNVTPTTPAPELETSTTPAAITTSTTPAPVPTSTTPGGVPTTTTPEPVATTTTPAAAVATSTTPEPIVQTTTTPEASPPPSPSLDV